MQRGGPQSWAGAGSRAGAVSRDTACKPGDAQHLLTCEKWGNDGGRDPERGSWAVWLGRCHQSAPAWTPHALRPWAQEGRAVRGGREPGAAWEPSVGSGWVGVIHSPAGIGCAHSCGDGAFRQYLAGRTERETHARPSLGPVPKPCAEAPGVPQGSLGSHRAF